MTLHERGAIWLDHSLRKLHIRRPVSEAGVHGQSESRSQLRSCESVTRATAQKRNRLLRRRFRAQNTGRNPAAEPSLLKTKQVSYCFRTVSKSFFVSWIALSAFTLASPSALRSDGARKVAALALVNETGNTSPRPWEGTEPLRVPRRLFGLSGYAVTADCSASWR